MSIEDDYECRNHTHESATRNSLPAGYDEVHLRSEENGHRDALCHILECGQTHGKTVLVRSL